MSMKVTSGLSQTAQTVFVAITSFVIGSAITLIVLKKKRYDEDIQDNNFDDNCFSLFYDTNLASDGSGMPLTKTCSPDIRSELFSVKPEFKFLSKEFYSQAVETLPTVCVDVMCQRKSDGKFLLFFRRDAPAAGIWWWPGGRSFRGETFYETAIRKAADETGANRNDLTPKAIVQTWNTFFPDSSWDKDRKPGYEGCQTVNIVVLCELNANDVAIAEETKVRWAVSGHRWVTIEEMLMKGKFDKYVRLNALLAKRKGLI